MFGREVRTRLSLLNKAERDKVRIKQAQYFKGKREIDFEPGEIVYVRDYKYPAKPTWRKAIIKNKLDLVRWRGWVSVAESEANGKVRFLKIN